MFKAIITDGSESVTVAGDVVTSGPSTGLGEILGATGDFLWENKWLVAGAAATATVAYAGYKTYKWLRSESGSQVEVNLSLEKSSEGKA